LYLISYKTTQGPAEIALPCDDANSTGGFSLSFFAGSDSHSNSDNNDSSASADTQAGPQGDTMSEAPWSLSWDFSSGFQFTALLPTDSMWMVNDLAWHVEEPAGVGVLDDLVASANNKSYVW
jgi:hypothetical protein